MKKATQISNYYESVKIQFPNMKMCFFAKNIDRLQSACYFITVDRSKNFPEGLEILQYQVYFLAERGLSKTTNLRSLLYTSQVSTTQKYTFVAVYLH